MPEHEDFYTPEHVDEQVDALLQARDMPLRDQRLASDLQSILEHGDEDAYSLQRVLQKLVGDDTSAQQQGKIIPIAGLRPHQQEQGRFVAMPDTLKHSIKNPQARPIFRVVTTLAAVLVVAVLVGSMLFVLNASHQKPTGTTTAHSNVATQTPAPAAYQGQVIYRSQELGIPTAAVWSPDGSRVAIALDKTMVESWDALTGKHILAYPISGDFYVTNVAWSPDGTQLAVAGSSKIYLFNAKTAQLLHSFPSQSVAFNNVAAPLSANGTAHSTVPLSSMLPLSGDNTAFENVAWSSDGKYLVSALNTPQGSQVFVWDAASGSVVKTLTGFNDTILSVSWSPRGNWLSTVAYPAMRGSNMTPEAKIWNTTTWQVVKQYANIAALDWSPDGKQLALVEAWGGVMGGNGKDVSIVDALTGQTIVKQFAGSQSAIITAIHWSPDGSRLALETQDYPGSTASTTLWNALSGTLVYSFPGKHSVYNSAWSPDSKHISSVQTMPDPSASNTDQNALVAYLLIWVA